MQLLHVGAAVLNQTPLAWDANKANILAAIAEARVRGVSVLCLPELCISGYGCEDAFLSPAVQRMAWRVLTEILPETRGMIVSLGLPLLYQNALYDVACLAVDGRIAGFTAKRYLAGDGIHYEPRWFKPWPLGRRTQIEIEGHDYPLGDIYFDCGGMRIGFEICEDAWVANRPGAELSQHGIDIILNPSASHFAFGKMAVRERFVLEGSRAFGVHYVYANLVGNEAGRAIYDGGALIASAGKMVATGPRFSFANSGVTSALVDIDAARLSRARSGVLRPNCKRTSRIAFACRLNLRTASRLPRAQTEPSGRRAPASKRRNLPERFPWPSSITCARAACEVLSFPLAAGPIRRLYRAWWR